MKVYVLLGLFHMIILILPSTPLCPSGPLSCWKVVGFGTARHYSKWSETSLKLFNLILIQFTITVLLNGLPIWAVPLNMKWKLAAIH